MPAQPWADAMVVPLAGHAYVMGLDWRSPPDRNIRRAAANAVAAASGSLAAVRRDRRQYGLGPAAAKGATAAAAVLASIRPGAWLGVWARPDGGYWGVAARHGTLYPMFGDVVLADETEARIWLARHLETMSWDHVFAPNGWAGATSVTATLPELFARRRSGPTLADPRHLPVRRLTVVAVSIAVAGSAGVIGFEHWAASSRQAAIRMAETAQPSVPRPEAPPISSAIAACLTGLASAVGAGAPAGWTPGLARCVIGGGQATAHVALQARDWTPIALHPAGRAGGIDVDIASRTARVERRRPLQPAARLVPAPSAAARLAIARLAAVLDGQSGRALAVTPRPPVFDTETRAMPDWTRFSWTLTTAAPPRLWQPSLSALPATAIETIELDQNRRSWRISGWTVTEISDD